MTVSESTAARSRQAQDVWFEYERRLDLSEKEGQTARIDPASGAVWIGESIQEVVAQRDAG